MELKIGKKTYKLQFGYAVVARGGITKKLLDMQDMFDENNEQANLSDGLEKMMGTLDELMLAALQKNHADEFGYQVRTGNGHDEALEKVDALLDTYLDQEDADPMTLITDLTEELENNGFLRHILRQEDNQTESQD